MIDEADLRRLVELFYGRVRADSELGPIFNGAVHDWSDHYRRLTDFWSSVMLASGRYKGNPVALHMLYGNALTAERFDRWLSLWREASNEMLPPPVAQAMQNKAQRIAESLQLAIRYRPGAVDAFTNKELQQ